MAARPGALGTPLVRLSRFAPGGLLYGKAELMLPSGSAYDRIAHPLIAEASGPAVVAGGGSVALAFAAAAVVQERALTVVVPASTLPEHLDLLRRFPCEVVLVEGDLIDTHDRAAAVEGELLLSPRRTERAARLFAQVLAPELADAFAELAPEAPEVLAGPIGEGAMLAGTAAGLASLGFSVTTLGTVRADQGGSVQDGVLRDRDASAEATRTVAVTDEVAHAARLELARTEGVLVGLGAAGAAHVAREVALQGERVCVLLVDAGDRYFSVDRKLGGSRQDGSNGSNSHSSA